jgi:hypothetical protein
LLYSNVEVASVFRRWAAVVSRRFDMNQRAYHEGGVVTAHDDKAVIEVSGVRWKIRRATAGERHYRPPRGMMTEEWIIEAGLT